MAKLIVDHLGCGEDVEAGAVHVCEFYGHHHAGTCGTARRQPRSRSQNSTTWCLDPAEMNNVHTVPVYDDIRRSWPRTFTRS